MLLTLLKTYRALSHPRNFICPFPSAGMFLLPLFTKLSTVLSLRFYITLSEKPFLTTLSKVILHVFSHIPPHYFPPGNLLLVKNFIHVCYITLCMHLYTHLNMHSVRARHLSVSIINVSPTPTTW